MKFEYRKNLDCCKIESPRIMKSVDCRLETILRSTAIKFWKLAVKKKKKKIGNISTDNQPQFKNSIIRAWNSSILLYRAIAFQKVTTKMIEVLKPQRSNLKSRNEKDCSNKQSQSSLAFPSEIKPSLNNALKETKIGNTEKRFGMLIDFQIFSDASWIEIKNKIFFALWKIDRSWIITEVDETARVSHVTAEKSILISG